MSVFTDVSDGPGYYSGLHGRADMPSDPKLRKKQEAVAKKLQ